MGKIKKQISVFIENEEINSANKLKVPVTKPGKLSVDILWGKELNQKTETGKQCIVLFSFL